MRLSGHRLVRTVVAYYEQAEVLNSPAADLLARHRARVRASTASVSGAPSAPAAVES